MAGRHNTGVLYKGIISIDAIYNMPEPDAGWIYKNPDTYKRRANTKK